MVQAGWFDCTRSVRPLAAQGSAYVVFALP
jgi:hypothetical protein